jgi:hypothetical protein
VTVPHKIYTVKNPGNSDVDSGVGEPNVVGVGKVPAPRRQVPPPLTTSNIDGFQCCFSLQCRNNSTFSRFFWMVRFTVVMPVTWTILQNFNINITVWHYTMSPRPLLRPEWWRERGNHRTPATNQAATIHVPTTAEDRQGGSNQPPVSTDNLEDFKLLIHTSDECWFSEPYFICVKNWYTFILRTTAGCRQQLKLENGNNNDEVGRGQRR